jgi:hypothetical protein
VRGVPHTLKLNDETEATPLYDSFLSSVMESRLERRKEVGIHV